MNLHFHFKIHFLWLRGTGNGQILVQTQETYGTDAILRRPRQRWIHNFADGKTELDSAPRSGRPTNRSNKARVRKLIGSEPYIAQKTIASRLGIHQETLKLILKHELGLVKGNFK
jgi:DNA invertase Pin-like site-specific DNA recombinase